MTKSIIFLGLVSLAKRSKINHMLHGSVSSFTEGPHYLFPSVPSALCSSWNNELALFHLLLGKVTGRSLSREYILHLSLYLYVLYHYSKCSTCTNSCNPQHTIRKKLSALILYLRRSLGPNHNDINGVRWI